MRRATAAAVAIAIVAIAVVTFTGGSPHRSRRPMTLLAASRFWSASSGAATLPGDCIPQNLPGKVGELGVVGVFGATPAKDASGNPSGQLAAKPGSLTAGPVSVPGINGELCGTVAVAPSTDPICPASGQVTIPKDGQRFSPTIKAGIAVIPGIFPQLPFTPQTQQIVGNLVCNHGSSSSGLQAQVNAIVGGGASLFGVDCVVTVHLSLVGSATGPLLGIPGWYLGGTFTSDDFSIPAVGPTPSCPPGVASNLNSIVGLPLAPGRAILNLPFALEVYAP
jgi:hypothetical protein